MCLHRVLQLARDYATRRTAFGKLLKDHPLHMQTLARMEVSWQGVNKLHSVFCHASGHMLLTPTGRVSRGLSSGDGCVSSVGPRRKWSGNRTRCSPSPAAHSGRQTVHWEAGEQFV